MYIVKIQGTANIPDFIQIRDNDFTLIAYFRINNPRKALQRCNLIHQEARILKLAADLPYGKIIPLDVNPLI